MDRGAWQATIHRVAGSDTTEVTRRARRARGMAEQGPRSERGWGVTGGSSGEEVGSAKQTEGWEGTWAAWGTARTRA